MGCCVASPHHDGLQGRGRFGLACLGTEGKGMCVVGIAPASPDCCCPAGCPWQPSAGGDAV